MSTESVDLSITCLFPPGKPLGITFEWSNGLRIVEIHDDITYADLHGESSGNNPLAPSNLELSVVTMSKLEPGDVLSSVNGQDVTSLDFTDVVALLRSVEAQERQLQFNRNKTTPVITPMALDNDPESTVSDDGSSENGSSTAPENQSHIHARIHRSLASSVTLDALHVNVINLSYWYKSRRELGGRKAMAVVIQQNKQSMRYESNMFVYKLREEDGEMGPCRKFLSSHGSKWNAYRHCEAMMKERDAPPGSKKVLAGGVSPGGELGTHFRVVVVSEVFYRMANSDR